MLSAQTPHAKLTAIDPGTDTVGIAHFHFDPITTQIFAIQAHTLHTSRQCPGTWRAQMHSERFDRIVAIQRYLHEQFLQFEPNLIACESPYISMRTPTAFAALTEAVLMIRQAVAQYSPWLGLDMVDPTSVKRVVGIKGKADSDKDKVKRALQAIPEIVAAMTQDLQLLDEHSVDAIAVGYYRLQGLRSSRT